MHVLRTLAKTISFLACAVVIALPLPARAAGWELVFSDEFNGDTLDRNKWATRYIYENETLDRFNDEKQRYRDNQNHVFADGTLALVARKGEADLYESGMIRTHRTFYYGYFEARVFLPSARGVWPAFWLVGDYDLDGKTWHPPEADIFEYVLNYVEEKDNMLHSQVQGVESDNSVFTYVDPAFDLKWKNLHAEMPLNKGWHTAGYVWAPDRVSFFWDGRHIYTRKYEWLKKDGTLGPPAQLILNFAIGGAGWAGRHGIDQAAFPQSFQIDYVRVCQLTSSERGTRHCGDSTVTPDPGEFGYSAPFNDMAKPAFLPIETQVRGSHPSGRAVSISQSAAPQDITVPFTLPEGYPNDRTLTISLIDESNQAVIFSDSAKLGDSATIKQFENVNFRTVTAPPLHPGHYRLTAHMEVESVENGKKEVRWAPLTCSTGIEQPEKSRLCKLLSIRANAG